jgi:hypothetical protein
MKTRRVLCITEQMTFHQSISWEVHTRYALQQGGGEVKLPAGTWLVELDPVQTWLNQETEYHYRLPSGEVVSLESPLAEGQFSELTDSQALMALNAFRSLDTILGEDFGISLLQTCHELPPFALIQCPLCFGISFTTVDLASAWCDRCNAAFHVRSTAGDPGFVVDVTWQYYNPLAAHYILPRTDKLLSTLVLKDSRDPRDMSQEFCSDECKAGPMLMTDGSTGLRSGLHQCQVGTLYDWRCIYGRVPTPEDLGEDSNWKIDGQWWPAAATVRVLSLKHSERRLLELAVYTVQKELASVAQEIQDILNLHSQSPSVFEALFPDVQNLQENERYLLHHWLTLSPESPFRGYEIALPVWYVVTPILDDQYLVGWKVVRKDICPRCSKPVSIEDFTDGMNDFNRQDTPHSSCRETWRNTGWRLPGCEV